MRAPLLILLAIFSISAASAEPAKTPVAADMLRPSGPWRVDYGQNECTLFRSFGSGNDQVLFKLIRRYSLEQFDGLIVGASLPAIRGRATLSLRFAPDSAERKLAGYGLQRPDPRERIIGWEGADISILDSISETQVLEIGTGKSIKTALLLAGGKSAIKSLGKCHDDLLASAGIDATALKAIKSSPKPVGRPETWVTGNDYPKEAWSANLGGTVDFMVIVDQTGKPTGCKIVRSSRTALLDTTTCDLLMRRAKFTPARSTDGSPVIGFYFDQVNWIIPRD